MDIEVTDAPELSVGGPPSVPSRISVVLVEEAKAGGTPRLRGTLSSSDIAGRLLPVVPAGISFPVGPDADGLYVAGGPLSHLG